MSDQSELDELEALKKRKEKLLLEREISRLEREQQFDGSVGTWRWVWVAPLAIVGALLFVAGIDEGEPVPLVLGPVALAPLIIKLWRGRKR